MAVCQPLSGADGLFSGVLDSADCFITGQVGETYAALLTPSGEFAFVVTTMLTLYVALFGYRLLLGQAGLSLVEVVPHFARIGVVLALVTSWPAYQSLVFNLLFHGPEQLIGALASGGSPSGAGSRNVIEALQTSFDRMTDIAGKAWDMHEAAPGASAAAQASDKFAYAAPDAKTSVGPGNLAVLGAPQLAAVILWICAALLVAGSIGALLVVRIVLGLLLLIGPVFIIAGLFAGTRGLLEGWLRVAIRYALTPLFTVLGSLGLVPALSPFLAILEASSEPPDMKIVNTILLITLVFVAVLSQSSKLAGAVGAGVRLPRRRATVPQVAVSASPMTATPRPMPTRAEAIVNAITKTQELGPMPDRILMLAQSAGGPDKPPSNAPATVGTSNRLGQSYRRLSVTTSPGVVR